MEGIKKVETFLAVDNITKEGLETFLEVGFKMEVNPLPLVRKWIKRNGINDVEVRFSNKTLNEINSKNKKNKKNIIVVRVTEGNCGSVDKVDIHFFPANI